jgi:probable F420-dependent oxidoreductase
MKFGVMIVGLASEPEATVAVAQLAEAIGFESLWTVEHVVVPTAIESIYPYSPDGRLPGTGDQGLADPLIWLSWIAAHTTTLNVGTGILILPQRNPVVLSKEVASLDALSRGRVLLGVGVGWLREEFDALGVPWDRRGARTDDYIAAMRGLWHNDVASHDGEFVSFDRVRMYPKPARPGGVPIHIGGHTASAARRAGRLGDGFFPMSLSDDLLDEVIGLARSTAREHGRDAAAIEVTCSTPTSYDKARRRAERLAADRLTVLVSGRSFDDVTRQLETFANDVIQRW